MGSDTHMASVLLACMEWVRPHTRTHMHAQTHMRTYTHAHTWRVFIAWKVACSQAILSACHSHVCASKWPILSEKQE